MLNSLKKKYDTCAIAVYSERGPGNKKINVRHIPIELTSTLPFFALIRGQENNVNLLLRPQINTGTPIKRPAVLTRRFDEAGA